MYNLASRTNTFTTFKRKDATVTTPISIVQGDLSLASFIEIDMKVGVLPAGAHEVKVFLSLFPDGGKIIEIGAGYGRVARELFGRGKFTLSATEPNPDYRTYLERALPKMVVLPHSVQDMPIEEHYHVAYAPYGFLNMFDFEEQERLIERLAAIADRVVFDIILPRPGTDRNITLQYSEMGNGVYTCRCYFQNRAWYERMAAKLGKKVWFKWYRFCWILIRGWRVFPVYHVLAIFE